MKNQHMSITMLWYLRERYDHPKTPNSEGIGPLIQ